MTSMISYISIAIYNKLPLGKNKECLRNLFYKFTPMYDLSRITRKVDIQNGLLFIELDDGTKFYGEQDKIISKGSILTKIDKFKDLIKFEGVLNLICYQYIKFQYVKYYHLKEGDIVVDAGAQIGTFTVKAAQTVGDKGKVIALEPEVQNLMLLRKNIEANGLRNVVIIPKGVWSLKSKLNLNVSSNQTGHSLYRGKCYGTDSTSTTEEIEVDNIDNILKQLGIKRVNFIKMDIEGAEIEALKGMTETIKNNNVKLAIEAVHIINGEETYKVIIPQLIAKGFVIRRERDIVYARRKDRK